MTAVVAVELDFADGTYLFDLRLPQLDELQTKRKCGVFALYSRVMRGRGLLEGVPVSITTEAESFAEDLFETIRLGLVGGASGMVDGKEVAVTAIMAKRLVENYCHSRPLRESWSLAAAILMARIEGYNPPKVEPAKEPAAAGKKTSTSRK